MKLPKLKKPPFYDSHALNDENRAGGRTTQMLIQAVETVEFYNTPVMIIIKDKSQINDMKRIISEYIDQRSLNIDMGMFKFTTVSGSSGCVSYCNPKLIFRDHFAI